ncbi:hypothetical protein [Nocardia sp. NPDC004860]|uniref:hypothetical protein n=1 Tax=Nocardia sp. NPDC004860 TaxID=3154557 RepID=UPI00339E9FC5
MSRLPTQEQIFTKAADAAHAAAGALAEARELLWSDWSDTESLTNEAADALTSVHAKLASLKADIYEVEQLLRDGATSLRDRR